MILFLVSSGMATGIGHVRRSAQLASELRNRKYDVVFCIKHEFGTIEAFKNYEFGIFLISSLKHLPSLLSLYPEVKLIVSDLADITREDTRKIASLYPKIKLLALDYFDMKDDRIDTIINLCNHNEQFERPVSQKVKYLEGPLFGILRPEFKNFLKNREKKINTSVERLLISFGGSDPCQHTLSIIPFLNNLLANHKCSVTIVIGPNFIHKNIVVKAVNNCKFDVSLVENPDNIAKLMNEADICICGAGTTILELAALGTPAMIIPQSKAENNFSKLFETAGFARVIGSPDGIDKEKLEESFVYFNNQESLELASQIGQRLCDGEGEQRIINEIDLLLK